MKLGIIFKDDRVSSLKEDDNSILIYDIVGMFYREMQRCISIDKDRVIEKVMDNDVRYLICGNNVNSIIHKVGLVVLITPNMSIDEALEEFMNNMQKIMNHETNIQGEGQVFSKRYEYEVSEEVDDWSYFDDDDIGGS